MTRSNQPAPSSVVVGGLLALAISGASPAMEPAFAALQLGWEASSLEGEVAAMRRARLTLAAEIQELEAQLSARERASELGVDGQDPADGAAPVDPVRAARKVVDTGAEVKRARDLRRQLAADVASLDQALSTALLAHQRQVASAQAQRAALAVQVEMLLAELKGAEQARAEAETGRASLRADTERVTAERDALRTQLESLDKAIGVQSAGRESLEARVEEMEAELAQAREVAADLRLETVQLEVNGKDLLAKLTTSDARRLRAEDELEAAQSRVEGLSSEAEQLVAEIDALEISVDTTRSENAAIAGRLEERSRALETIVGERDVLRTRADDLAGQLAALQQDSRTFEAQQASAMGRIGELESEMRSVAADRDVVRSELAATLQRMERLDAEREQLAVRSEERAGLEARIEEMTAELVAMRAREDKEAAPQGDGFARAELAEVRGENRDLLSAVERLGTQLEEKNQLVVATERERARLASELQAAERDVAARQAASDTLEERVDTLSGELAATREEATAARVVLEREHAARIATLAQENSRSRSETLARLVAVEAERDELRNHMAEQIDELERSESAIRSENTELAGRLEERSRALETTAGERDALRERVDDVVRQLAALQQGSQTYEARQASAKSRIGELESELRSVTADRDSARSEFAATRQQMEQLATEREQLAKRSEERARLEARIEEMTIELAALRGREERNAESTRQAVDLARAALAGVQGENRELLAELAASRGEASDRRSALEREHAQQLETLEQHKARLQATESQTRARLAVVEDERDKLRGALERRGLENEQLGSRLEALESTRRDLERKLGLARATVASLTDENTALGARLSALMVRNEEPEEVPIEVEAESPRAHVVQSGESLSGIAERYLGSSGRWREIYEANRDRMSNPDVIAPGIELVIPAPADR